MLQTAYNTLAQGATTAVALARQNYITTSAALSATAGLVHLVGKQVQSRNWAALKTAKKSALDTLFPDFQNKLVGWRHNGDQLASNLVDHIGNGLSVTLRNLHSDKIFQDAANAAEILEDESKRIAARPEEFRVEKLQKALDWLDLKIEETTKKWSDYGKPKESATPVLKRQGTEGSLLSAFQLHKFAVVNAKKTLGAEKEKGSIDKIDEILAGVEKIQATMDGVKNKLQEAQKEETNEARTKGEDDPEFEKDDVLDELADKGLKTTCENKGKVTKESELKKINDAIDVLTDLDPFVKTIDRPVGLWNGIGWGVGFAALIMTLNHGLPRLLGLEHRVVQVLRLPA